MQQPCYPVPRIEGEICAVARIRSQDVVDEQDLRWTRLDKLAAAEANLQILKAVRKKANCRNEPVPTERL